MTSSIMHWGGGALLLVLTLTHAASAELGPSAPQMTLFDRFTTWKYEDSGTDLGTAWRAPGYDDAGWEEGPGFLGYGENMVTTEVSYGPDPSNKYRTTYFRSTFTLSEDPATFQRLLLGANYDDGFVLYLNGTEVARGNMPAGTILYGTFASSTTEGEGHRHIDLSPFIGELIPGENTLAAEVHQRSLSSSDLIWDMELEATPEATLVTRGPYLQLGSPSGAVIRWRTDVPTTGRVWFGEEPGALTMSVSEVLAATEHEVSISGLSPDTEYVYAIGTAADLVLAGDTGAYAFRTHPPVGATDPVRIWAYGDGGEANEDQTRVRDSYANYPGADQTDVWLILGDNAYDEGTDDEYQSGLFEELCSFLRNTFIWPTRGNHDDLHTGFDYYDVFSLPDAAQSGGLVSGTEAYYSFDHGNVHFVCLDSDGSDRTPGGAMLTWLEADLAATTQTWVIAYWHHPPYTKGTHDSDDTGDSGGRMRDMRVNALPILEDYGVDLVLSGHSHSYERTYFIDGHYGISASFNETMVLNWGSGDGAAGAPYTKPTDGLAPHEGTVYAVAGSFSFTEAGPFDHPAMRVSLQALGSMVIDVAGSQLDARFLDADGAVRDAFTIVKGITVDAPAAPEVGTALRVHENPTAGAATFTYAVAVEGRATVRVFDARGRRVRELVNEPSAAGASVVTWDGRDERGEAVASGVYYVVLESADGVRARPVVVAR